MRRRHEDEISYAMAQTVDLEKLAQLEVEANTLKSQLAFCKIELSALRTKCEEKSAEIVELRRQLDLETARSRENKAEAQKCATHAEEQVLGYQIDICPMSVTLRKNQTVYFLFLEVAKF